MAQLHKGLRKLARNWLNSLPVEVGETRIADLYGLAFNSFATILLRTSPWQDLLTYSDVIHTTDRVRRFADRFPVLYKGPLEHIPVDGLVDEIEDHLVSFLESLPRRYFVYVQLPRMPLYGVPVTELVYGVQLVQTVPGFDENLMLATNAVPTFEILTELPDKLFRDTTYLRFAVDGYANSSPQSYSVARAIGNLKHFLFMSLREGAFRQRDLADILGTINWRVPKPSVDGFVYCQDDVEDCHRFFVPEELSEFLGWIRLNEENLEVPDEKGKTLLDFRPAKTGAEKVKAMSARLHMTGRFFEIPPDWPDAERIRAAMEWWLDSEAVDNHTVAFLQACIGLEALLGDADDKSRVKDKLSDRYSYLLGKTFGEREDLKKRFVAMYDHRSTLVHGRRARLGTDGMSAMIQAKDMLSKGIRAEVANLLRTIREQQEEAARKAKG